MPEMDFSTRQFSFQRRPTPVPGDLRISWRVALILMMLGRSRSNRASLAKLHILNDVVRSENHDRLKIAVSGDRNQLPWSFRIEPAFARAIDFVVGEQLATWTKASGRAALQLTMKGIKSSNVVLDFDEALTKERTIVSELAKIITETTVGNLLGGRRI